MAAAPPDPGLVPALLAGRFLAWLGPALLGPSYAERLQRLEADAVRATERNRIAREIHDSAGRYAVKGDELAGKGRSDGAEHGGDGVEDVAEVGAVLLG